MHIFKIYHYVTVCTAMYYNHICVLILLPELAYINCLPLFSKGNLLTSQSRLQREVCLFPDTPRCSKKKIIKTAEDMILESNYPNNVLTCNLC